MLSPPPPSSPTLPPLCIHQLGPEKGVIHLATAALVNALWDLWARKEGKPLWRLLVDMPPAQLVSTIDFRYIRDALVRWRELLKHEMPEKKVYSCREEGGGGESMHTPEA